MVASERPRGGARARGKAARPAAKSAAAATVQLEPQVGPAVEPVAAAPDPVTPAPTPEAAAPAAAVAGDSKARVGRLRDRVSKLRVRGGVFSVEWWLVIIGGLMITAGIPIILLGWYGAAHTPYLFEQVPYLISGGLLGVGLVAGGGFLYFTFWLTRQVQASRRQQALLQQLLTHIDAWAARAAMGSANGNGDNSAGNGAFVATAKGSMFHRPDCAVVVGRGDLRQVSAETKGMQPCKMCDPLGQTAAPA